MASAAAASCAPTPSPIHHAERHARADQRMRTHLDTLIRAAGKCRAMPAPRDLMGSVPGLALVNAMYDVTQLDALYDRAAELDAEIKAENLRCS